MKKYLAYSFVALIFWGCRENNEEIINPVGKLASLEINFNNVVGDEELILDSTAYINVFEQQFTVAKFNYYISNIELKLQDGSYVKIEKDSSYFLIKEKDTFSQKIKLNWLPEGTYTGIRYVLGVDSIKSSANISERTGVLDIGGYASDMYWTWAQGYIFMKLECHKYQSKGSPGNPIPYVYHIGGFGATGGINNLKTIELDFPSNLDIKQDRNAKLFIKTDVLKVITGTTNINFEVLPTVMLTPTSKLIAENYKHMFSISKVE